MSLPDIATPYDLEQYQDGDPEAIVRQAQGFLRRYCGWHVADAIDEEMVLDGKGSRHMWLPTLQVNDITSVTNAGDEVDLTDDLDWSATGYLELRCGTWTQRPRQVVVTLNHGYEDIPDELIEVIVSIASRAMSSPSGAIRSTTGPFSAEWSAVAPGVAGGLALLQHERAVLDSYKLPPRP